MAENDPATLRIPLVWTSAQRLRHGAVLGAISVVPLSALTLPFLWLNAVAWLISIAAVLVAVILIVRWLLIRTECIDIQKNGPFIEITQGVVRFPPGLAERHGVPTSIALADIEAQAWFTQTTYSNGHGYHAQTGYLDLAGGEIDLLLATGNKTGALHRLERLRSDVSLLRVRDRSAIPVDGQSLVSAAQFFRILQEKRAAARAAQAAIKSGADPVPEARTETPSEANVAALLLQGTLRHVPPDLGGHARNWRDGYGGNLLHQPGSTRAVDALVEAGLDLQSRDAQGRTVLMVYGRSPEANRRLIAAGVPLNAVCNQGHDAVWHQLAPSGIGFVPPDYAGVEALISAGLPPPTRAEAAILKEVAAGTVTSGAEHQGWLGYCIWLDQAALDRSPSLGRSDSSKR